MLVTGNKPTYYSLSIRVKADGFSFIVTEDTSGDNLLCEDFKPAEGQTLPALLEEKLQDPAYTLYPYGRVRATIYSDSTFIPQSEFDASQLPELYGIIFPKLDASTTSIAYNHLAQLDIVTAFPLRHDIRQAITRVYPDASFTCASSVVLGRIATFCKRQQLPDNAVFAYVTPTQLFLFSLCGEQLKFANTFPLDQPRDSVFYLLSVWKMLELNARHHHCYIAGENDSVDYLTEEARKFIQNVQTLTLSIE